MKLTKRSAYIFLTILITIVIDQISKVIVRKYVDSKEVIHVIGEYFSLHNVENKGAFLGMGSELNPTLRIVLLLILPIIVLGYILRYILKDKSLDNWSLFAFASIIGGGIANVFDRVVFGSVTDFFYIRITDLLRTGIFNMADLSVTTGMIILVIASFKKKKS
tara:strand:+ start:50777 stop:51265 length:489 start_codon:yes stop_codon:yes gene_type:complete